MPRPHRLYIPDGVVHAASRGNRKAKIFLDDQDHFRFMDIMVKLKEKYQFRVYAYCLMTNHWHFLLKGGLVSPSKIFRLALSEYGTYFNKRYKLSGHVFQGRFWHRNVEKESYFLGAMRYIHLNPVEAGMVEKPEDWRWSGYAEFMGRSNYKLMDYDLPMSMFSEDAVRSEMRYKEFMSAKRRRGPARKAGSTEKLEPALAA